MTSPARICRGSAAAALTPLVLAVVAGLIAIRGAGSIPLEDHDVLVAQTAQNMLASGDWVVPRFNNEYRLQKPPLSYWFVALIAKASNQQRVTPMIARAPSILAAIGLVLLAYWLAMMLFGFQSAVLGALFTLTALDFFQYSHSARPDMLYAFWTTAVFTAWVASARADSERTRAWAYLLWVFAGLATLTKGPQAPAILLVALILHAVLTGTQWRAIFRRLRPFGGLCIYLLLVSPWWWLLRQAVGAHTLADSQLSGALLAPGSGASLGPYYFIRSPLAWLPWALILPCAAIATNRNWRSGAGLLATTVVVATLVFTFGPQYRQHYMLPWLVPACVWLAVGATSVASARYWLWLPWAAGLAGVVWLVIETGLAALPFVSTAAVMFGWAAYRLARGSSFAGAALTALAFAAALLQAGATPAVWSKSRYQQVALAARIQPLAAKTTAVATVGVGASTFVYYLQHPVADLRDVDALCRWLPKQRTPVLIIFANAQQTGLQHRLILKSTIKGKRGGFSATLIGAKNSCLNSLQ